MNQHSNPWTPERDAQLADFWRDGITTVEIGRRLGVSKGAVIGRAYRLQLPRRACFINVTIAKRWTKEDDAFLRRIYGGELTIAEIAIRMERGPHSIAYRAKFLGLVAKRRAPSKSRAVVARPAARVPFAPLVKDTRAASPSRPSAAINSGDLSSAVERLGASTQVENLPGAAADEAPRWVFSDRQCSFVLTSTGRQHRYCDEPCVANERGRPSPYCPDHYAICIIGAPGPNMPPIFKWRD